MYSSVAIFSLLVIVVVGMVSGVAAFEKEKGLRVCSSALFSLAGMILSALLVHHFEAGLMFAVPPATGIVYTVVGLPDDPGLRVVNVDKGVGSYLYSFQCEKIRGGCVSIPVRGIPFKLVEGTGEDDLVVVAVDTVALSDAAKTKTDKK